MVYPDIRTSLLRQYLNALNQRPHTLKLYALLSHSFLYPIQRALESQIQQLSQELQAKELAQQIQALDSEIKAQEEIDKQRKLNAYPC